MNWIRLIWLLPKIIKLLMKMMGFVNQMSSLHEQKVKLNEFNNAMDKARKSKDASNVESMLDGLRK